MVVDPKTGEIAVTVAPAGMDGADEEKITVPVVVTYPKGLRCGYRSRQCRVPAGHRW